MTNKPSGRVTTRELYNALIEQTEKIGGISKEMSQMELRIVEKIHVGIVSQQEYRTQTDARLAAGSVHLKHLDDDVNNLKLWDKGIGILALIGTAIASAIGFDK